ncbi:MAG: thioredoxin-dependent thiol peroxidase [Spirochaetia bacterium]|nr:thioredoxin-dependent thiol peroxidase [Spirochaetia bacterium]
MNQLTTGDTAPDFSLLDQGGNRISLSDYRGQKVLLYFYPKADTPGCTKQACSIRDSWAELKEKGVVPIGISGDKPAAQQKFDAKYSLGFPLLSDADHEAADAYGVRGEKKMFGKAVMGTVRSSFLIDEEGRIVQAWYKVKPEETVPKALAAL